MSEIQVRRLRVSYVAGRIHDHIREIGGEQAFARRLADLAPVCGLAVDLPFAADLATDHGFWRSIAERDLPVPLSERDAGHCRRSGVPLRWRGRMEAASAVAPRIEAHLHRFGVVAIATVDLEWDEAMGLQEVARRVDALQGQASTVHVGDQSLRTTVPSAATEAVGALMSSLGDPQGSSWDVPGHRLVTVIEGVGGESDVGAMPTAGSPLHVSLHRLAGGDDAIATPAAAFVAQFTNAGYGFPPARMVYMLNKGTAALLHTALAREPQNPQTASTWHRERTLLTAYVSALAGLVTASPASSNVMFPAWAATAAKMLARLYGPGRGYLEWGRFPAELLRRTGSASAVGQVLGAQLTYNADFPFQPLGPVEDVRGSQP
jgi:hypothetical protein